MENHNVDICISNDQPIIIYDENETHNPQPPDAPFTESDIVMSEQ